MDATAKIEKRAVEVVEKHDVDVVVLELDMMTAMRLRGILGSTGCQDLRVSGMIGVLSALDEVGIGALYSGLRIAEGGLE